MPDYRFNGPYPAFYPGEIGPDGKSLEVKPGDIISADAPPSDGNWIEVDLAESVEPVKTRSKRSS